MALEDNERLQEAILLTEDKISLVDKKWWYLLAATIILAVPLYLAAKAGFIQFSMSGYEPPKLLGNVAVKQPLQVTGKGILDLGNGYYSAYAKIRNMEYEWGVSSQQFTAVFKTMGNTEITKINGSSYILPSKEKLLVFEKFKSDKKPEQMTFTLEDTHFIHRPTLEFNYELERISVNNAQTGLVVSAGIKNLTPFKVTKVDMPVAVYNSRNEIVAVNFTYINDLLSGETRTFQYVWPKVITDGTLRAEIFPEVNIFDREVFQVEEGGPSF